MHLDSGVASMLGKPVADNDEDAARSAAFQADFCCAVQAAAGMVLHRPQQSALPTFEKLFYGSCAGDLAGSVITLTCLAM